MQDVIQKHNQVVLRYNEYCWMSRAVRIGYVNDEFVVNPSIAQLAASKMNLTFAGTLDQVVMIECQAKEVG